VPRALSGAARAGSERISGCRQREQRFGCNLRPAPSLRDGEHLVGVRVDRGFVARQRALCANGAVGQDVPRQSVVSGMKTLRE